MAVTSLVVCADAKSVQVLSRVLQDLSIEVEHCGDTNAAAARLKAQRFDVLVLDCADEAAALQLLGELRTSSANKSSMTIAVVDATNNVRELFAHGANFVLYKPVSPDRVASSLRAARGLMPNERRRKPRLPVPASATIAYADVENTTANLMNLSEDGVAIRSQRTVPPRCKVYFEFSLPGEVSVIRLSGDVVWQDASGRVGLRFSRVPQSSRAVLDGWLQQNLGRQQQVSPLVIPDHASGDPVNPSHTGLGLLSVPAADRRGESRHSCRLGAEVYEPDSTTPQRCTLSDISSGGCYVETTEPLQTGTAVEIVVRTEEVKVRVHGKVQASHPGFGMGVEFTSNTASQREQVKQLVACQDAAEEAAKQK